VRFILALGAALACLLHSGAARAQFLPEAGPGREQQEFASTLLLGPEASVLGGFLGGGAVFLVEKNCCTKKGEDPAITAVAIGAGVGAAIGATWMQWSISNHYHPGSRVNSAIGGAIGAAGGAAAYFGGPAHESSNDQIFRVLAFLLAPSLGAYAGWHVGGEGGFIDGAAEPPVWADHVGFAEPRYPRALQTFSITF